MNMWRYGGIALIGVGVILIVIGIIQVIGGDSEEEALPSTTTSAPTTAGPPTTTEVPQTTATTSTTAAPTTTSTTTTSTTTSTTTTTTTTLPPESPEEFLELLVLGLRGNPEFLVSRLNQATLDIYGEEQCLQNLPGLLDPESNLEIREVGEPERWDYIIDEIVTPVEDAVPVEVERFVGGQTIIQEVHWKLVDGLWTWFSDCGEPLAG